MYTLDIAGKPIAITDADEAQSRELFNSDAFKEDIAAMESGGKPLWDGKAPLVIRPSTKEETDNFEQALDEGDDDEETDDDLDEDEVGINVLFLVPVDEYDED
ncbi:hypothetical protein [Salinarimonas soli]|uniref:Glutamine amidotransferase n=1 Tax=Salinarimonas soli TaxID=1638099 RepID=A0A5B2V867_9HYPH|nr:hypothetical protein [Salinarimonas soli]KAA2234397.1 hypothetical protein F0L46_24115 [Salinarimonas soli]